MFVPLDSEIARNMVLREGYCLEKPIQAVITTNIMVLDENHVINDFEGVLLRVLLAEEENLLLFNIYAFGKDISNMYYELTRDGYFEMLKDVEKYGFNMWGLYTDFVEVEGRD